MTPPTEPHARAHFIIQRLPDLTQSEKAALLAVWQKQGLWKVAIGPKLLGYLSNFSTTFAKKLLASLREKGYLISDGGDFRPGVKRVAARQITAKAGLPERPKSVTATEPVETTTEKIGDRADTECEKSVTNPTSKIGDPTVSLTVYKTGGLKSAPPVLENEKKDGTEETVTGPPWTWGKSDRRVA